MWNNMTNFLTLIRGRKIKTTLEDTDLIAIATKDPTFDGGYQPTGITVDDFIASIPTGGVQSVTAAPAIGGDVISVNNADPQNPIINFVGVYTDGTMSGDGAAISPLSANYQAPAVDGTTVTGDGTGGNPLVAPFQSPAVDGVTITGDGTPGNPLVAVGGGGAVNYANVFFVDLVNGNNGTAAQNDFTKPYLQVTTAVYTAAATSPTSTNRALVYVRRGEYTSDNFIELQNYVDVYCEPGVVFVGTVVTDSGVSVITTWTGKANFTGSIFASNELLRLTGLTSKVYFEFDELFVNRAAFGIFNGASATIVGRKVFAETFNTGFGMTTRTTGIVVLNITEEFAAWHDPISFGFFSGKFYMTCPRIYLHEGDTYGGNFKHVVIARNNLGGEAVINGDLIVNNIAGYYGGNSGALAQFVDAFMTIRINGNIYAENQFGVYGLGSSGAARLIVNGDVRTNHLVGYIASNCNMVFRNGTLMNWNNLVGVSEGYPVFSMGGSGKVWVENCHMYSLGTGATQPNIAGVWKDTTASQLCINNTVHSGSDAIGFFVRNSTPGQPVNNVRIMNSRSTKPLDTNIVDLLSPTGFVQDPNIIAIGFI